MADVTAKAPERRRGTTGNLQLVLDLLLWRIALSLGAPFRRLLAVSLFLGRSSWTLVAEVQRWLLSTVGWLSAPPSLPLLKQLGRGYLQLKRWHLGAGKS